MHLIVFYYFLHLANAFVNSTFILIHSEKKTTIQSRLNTVDRLIGLF